MNYTTQVGFPTAYITKKKSRLKIYNGDKVFLENGDNFEFEIYNPKQTSVLAKIKLDGKYISHAGVVIKPGQRVFLERFIDTNNKFQFNTYEVANTSQNRSAIDLNGDVVVEFYDEQEVRIYPHVSGGNWSNGWTTISTDYPYLGNTTLINSGSVGQPLCNVTSYYSSSDIQMNSKLSSQMKSSGRLKAKKSIETGRVEKGEGSNQTFTNSQQQFNYYTCHLVSYKILPQSAKHIDAEEIRHYCTECGTKVKKNFKFCPTCGNKI